ncbi:antitoxin [Mycobacterium sp. NS-7484]|uniref:ribbon-helix-helix domain-containing protein n=1 Tax=unclassified Mycobacterium TaxID=2642494 RepID=UPI0007FE4303|nr:MULTISPECIES: ribbon-helix-helix domain-containing protein [unclassified Mycobacterium]OBG84511.1 antitoxin [Mycobacterium sp. E802]OMC05690.1 antitoxin [Mycobacterium sp. NS-7484]
MKLSVSLSEDDVAVLDAYVEQSGLPSRSAAIQRAVQMLRYPNLEDDYDQAWAEWASSSDADPWRNTTADGIGDAAR